MVRDGRDERLGVIYQELTGTSHKKALKAKASLFSFNFAGDKKNSEGLGLAKKKAKVAGKKDGRPRDSPKKIEEAVVAVRKKIRVRRISSDDEDGSEHWTPPSSSSSSSTSTENESRRKKQKPVVKLNKDAVIILNRCNKVVPLKRKPRSPPPTLSNEANFGDLVDDEEPKTETVIENRAKEKADNDDEQRCTLEVKKAMLDMTPSAASTALVVAEPEALLNSGEFVVRIDSNENAYSQLTNTGVTGSEVVYSAGFFKTAHCLAYVTSNDVLYREIYPGVGGGSFVNSPNSSMGYLTISPKTVKPLEVTTNVQLTYWVLIGEVIVRSTACENSTDGNLVLSGKKLSAAACFIVPQYTPYTVENWSSTTSAVLGYVILPHTA